MANPIAGAFLEAAELIDNDEPRRGNCLYLEPDLEVLYAGDIHGHRLNLAKIIRFADLGFHPKRRLILQEILHGGPVDAAGGDRSFEPLLRAARLKISYPRQVFFLMGNHDLAQFSGQEITKNGRGLCRAFSEGLDHALGEDAQEVRDATYRLLQATPMAARCDNGVFMTHSLPGPARMRLLDWSIIERPYRPADFPRGGSLYEWTWGRGHTAEQVRDLAERLGARLFLLGHQPVESGFEQPCGGLAILASNHSHGQVAVFNSTSQVADEDLPSLVRPIAAL